MSEALRKERTAFANGPINFWTKLLTKANNTLFQNILRVANGRLRLVKHQSINYEIYFWKQAEIALRVQAIVHRCWASVHYWSTRRFYLSTGSHQALVVSVTLQDHAGGEVDPLALLRSVPMVEIFQDIRQPYDFMGPCDELAPYVEFFSQSAPARSPPPAASTYWSSTMFASWTPTCYINLGPAYVIDLADTRYTVRAGEDVLLLRNTAVARHKLAADDLFTLKFYPGGLEAVLGINQVQFADRLLPLTRVLPAPLLAHLKQPLPFAERVGLVEHFLLRAFRRPAHPDHYVRLVHDAIGEFQDSRLQLNASAVAERLFLTSKTINRYFHRVVGTSPSQYFAVLRARTALTAFVADPLAFAPSDHGYYDRSHFAKAVRHLTGQPLPATRR